MGSVMVAVMAVIVLGGPFGEATVEGTLRGDRLEVEFTVVVGGSPAAVLVHVVDPGQDQETFSLGNRGGGVWGGIADLDVMNPVVVFDVVYPDGEGEVSEPTTLLELGLDPVLIGMGPVPGGDSEDGDRPLSPVTRRWGWGAAALTAIALALLAVWAMGDRVKGKHAAPRRGTRKPAETERDEPQPS